MLKFSMVAAPLAARCRCGHRGHHSTWLLRQDAIVSDAADHLSERCESFAERAVPACVIVRYRLGTCLQRLEHDHACTVRSGGRAACAAAIRIHQPSLWTERRNALRRVGTHQHSIRRDGRGIRAESDGSTDAHAQVQHADREAQSTGYVPTDLFAGRDLRQSALAPSRRRMSRDCTKSAATTFVKTAHRRRPCSVRSRSRSSRSGSTWRTCRSD